MLEQKLYSLAVTPLADQMLDCIFASHYPLSGVLPQGQEDSGMGASSAIEGRLSSHGGRLCQ